MGIESDVMTTREAAAFLGTHVETVRRFARRGDIPSFKVGKDWRYRKAALQAWAESQHLVRKHESRIVAVNGVEARSPIQYREKAAQSVLESLDTIRRHLAAPGTDDGNAHDEAAASTSAFAASSETLRRLFQTVTIHLQKQLGCDAVGIRLRMGLDFPYYETRGFPPEFVLAEDLLCARNSMNEILRDSDGNPVIECMCGNVICGRFDPAKSFFTEQGSFWTNSTTELLASTTEEVRQARTRNRCNGEGYESVALFPLRLGSENLGLLQINHRERGLFTEAIVAILEQLAESLSLAASHAYPLEEKVPERARLLDGHNGQVLSGVSTLPASVSPLGRHGILVLELGLDATNHRVIDVACDELPKLGREMLCNLLVNRTLPGALREAKERITNGYHSDLRTAVVTALEQILRKYQEIHEPPRRASTSTFGSVLIIDDEKKVCTALARTVERFGCRARHATDATVGLELVAQETPDIILLDLVMPGMNGPTFLEKLRETHPHLPVVIITGYPDGDLMQEAARFAPVLLLAKPIEPGLLERTVRMSSRVGHGT